MRLMILALALLAAGCKGIEPTASIQVKGVAGEMPHYVAEVQFKRAR